MANLVQNGIDGNEKCAPKFYHTDLQIIRATPAQMKLKPFGQEEIANLKFGQIFADHMVEIDWTIEGGWSRPKICPVHDFQLHPATKIFHYAPSVFEGMKAFRGENDGQIRMFRPQMNMARMRRAAARASLPDFDPCELLAIIETLVRMDAEWIPTASKTCAASLYIRPALIATDATLELSSPKAAKLYVISGPVGAYFPTGLQPVTVLADPRVARSFPGGVGGYKMGCNYAPTIHVGKLAMEKFGCHQVLWLSGEDEKLTEVGVMNIFLFQRDSNGALELVTPPTTDCLVLDGVVRDSILAITREWAEFRVAERYPTMIEIREALREKRIIQLFGTGTACAVCPINKIVYKMSKGGDDGPLEILEIPSPKGLAKELDLVERLYALINGIHYGRIGLEGEKKEWIRILN